MARSIEVGNIFKLGTKFSEAFGLLYANEFGIKKPVWMGSYGIGPGRLMGTIVEVSHDAKGVFWPDVVAPFSVHLLIIKTKDEKAARGVEKAADALYQTLLAKGVEVLYDDRADKTAGEKFADSDLIGIPWRVVLSANTLSKKCVEVKRRNEKEARIMTQKEFLAHILPRKAK
mgnify:FL=1